MSSATQTLLTETEDENKDSEKAPGQFKIDKPGLRGDPEDSFRPADENGYIPPLTDPYKRSAQYIEKHKIPELFQSLTAQLVYSKPEDPIDFLMEKIQEIKSTVNPAS